MTDRPETGLIGLGLKNTFFIGCKTNSKIVFLAMLVLAVTKNDIFWRFLKGGANFESLYLGNRLSYRSETSLMGLGSKNTIFIGS